MKEELEGIRKENRGQEIICPRCHRAHYSGYPVMDEYIDCACGARFYAFSDSGLKIIMPQEEAGYEPIARAMRRFVVSTGRCSDIPPELYQDENGQLYFGITRNTDIEAALEIVLEQFQIEMFGEAYLTKDVIYSICESFQDGHDVELRKQKKRVDVIKLIKKKLPVEEKRRLPKGGTIDRPMQLSFPNFGIMRSSQSQNQPFSQ